MHRFTLYVMLIAVLLTPVTACAYQAAAPQDTSANIEFVRGMIAHHAQALEMTKLAAPGASRADVKLLAERIEASQVEEIARMRRWLAARNAAAPTEPAHEQHAPLMPGMLSAAEMARLAGARGTEFDRLFLEFMIKHHEGALTMVQDLFSKPAVAHDPELYRFASDVDADQRAEIARMRKMLTTFQ